MFSRVMFAAGFAFAAAIQPGPLQAFLLSQVAAKGWKRTLPAACSPLLSDGPIALLVLLVLQTVPHGIERGLQAAGGVLLLWFAAKSLRDWRAARAPRVDEARSAPKTLFEAALINLLNPNPYLGWSLVLGPLLLDGLAHGRAQAAAVVAAFYVTMVVMLALTIVAFGAMRSLGPRVARSLILVSAVTLAGLGVYQLARGVFA